MNSNIYFLFYSKTNILKFDLKVIIVNIYVRLQPYF